MGAAVTADNALPFSLLAPAVFAHIFLVGDDLSAFISAPVPDTDLDAFFLVCLCPIGGRSVSDTDG